MFDNLENWAGKEQAEQDDRCLSALPTSAITTGYIGTANLPTREIFVVLRERYFSRVLSGQSL